MFFCIVVVVVVVVVLQLESKITSELANLKEKIATMTKVRTSC